MKCLALGGNLGPVLDTFRRALAALTERGVTVVAVSRAYRTEAVTWPGSVGRLPPYWNAVCQVRSRLGSAAVLAVCKDVERAAGRAPGGPRWGSRPLDLDVLLWGDEVCDSPTLTLPHPRLHERLFVLRPLHELAPDVVVPDTGRTVADLLHGFADNLSGIMLRRAFWKTPGPEKMLAVKAAKSASQVIAPQGN